MTYSATYAKKDISKLAFYSAKSQTKVIIKKMILLQKILKLTT